MNENSNMNVNMLMMAMGRSLNYLNERKIHKHLCHFIGEEKIYRVESTPKKIIHVFGTFAILDYYSINC